jgi:DNA-directed RNA polymerase specialized sigma24 family protein
MQRYLRATATDADALLDTLLARVRGHVRQRLANRGMDGEDLEDLCAEALAHLVRATQNCRCAPHKPIENYLAYALTTADRVFSDAMRVRHPNRRRLKRRILYLLDGKAGGNLFARWAWSAAWLGGFLRWRGRPFAPTSRYQTFQESADPFRQQVLANREPETIPLPELMALLFRYLETPLEIEALTDHLAALCRLREPEVLALEEYDTPDRGALSRLPVVESEDLESRVVNALANREFQSRLWGQLCELPLDQRSALLLAMSPEMLLLLALVGPIANALQIPLPDFLHLWSRLPLPDTAIAAHLKLTVKQTQNLRLIARRRLLRHLAKRDDSL